MSMNPYMCMWNAKTRCRYMNVFVKPNPDKLACMLRRENVVAKIPMENAK